MELDDFLREFPRHHGWAVLAGSAISMPAPTAAPMVRPALEGLLRSAEAVLVGKHPALGQFVQDTLDDVDMGHLASNLKFELAIGHLNAQVTGLGDSVIRALYSTRQPNPNHFALAALLKSGQVNWLLTTNFDRALEAASGFPARPGYVPAPNSNAAIIKPHGDADSGQLLVATLDTMSQLKAIQAAKGLFTALKALGLENLLVVGYSGSGDVDIMPGLIEAQSNVTIWWAVRSGHAPSELGNVNEFSHDLLGTTDNALQRLAGTATPIDRPSDTDIASETSKRLLGVLHPLSPSELIRVTLALLLEAHFGQAAAQILLASRNVLSTGEFQIQMHLACERLMAYSLSRELLATTAPADEEEEASLLARQGFLLEQAGRYGEAIKLYERARVKLGSLEAAGISVGYRTKDFILRGWLELAKQQCFLIWNPSRRRKRANELLRACRLLQVAAQQEDVSTSAILDLREAELEFASAASEHEREAALKAGGDAIRTFMAIQHAEGVAAAERFLFSAGGKVGQQLVIERDPWRILVRPARDTEKLRWAKVQGRLPTLLFPWKFRLPWDGLQRRLIDRRRTAEVRRLYGEYKSL